VNVGASGVSGHTLASSLNPATYGSSITFTSTVTGSTTPTGNVTFYDGGAALGTTALAGGIATLTVNRLAVSASPHVITAVYNGDTTFTRATSGSVTQAVVAATLTPSVAVANRTYDGTTNVTITSLSLATVVSGDEPYVHLAAGAAGFADKTAGLGKPVSVTGLSLAGSLASNYALSTTSISTSANITNKTLTVTGITANSKAYDQSAAATLNVGSPVLVGVVAGDVVQLDATGATGTFNTPYVGTGKTVTVSGLTIIGLDSANYTLAAPTTPASITAVPLTITGAWALDKVYDGTTNATPVWTNAALVGVLSPDDVTINTNAATAAFTNKTVGVSKTVNFYGAQLAGALATNYSVSQPPATNASITVRNLGIGATGVNRTYDGTTNATVTLSSINQVSGDAITSSYGSAWFMDKYAGTGKPVSVAGISAGGADFPNYVLTNTTASATANVDQRSITVTATGQNKPYDGTTAATVTLSDNRVAGDSLVIAYTSATFANAGPGNAISITVNGIHFAGGSDTGNYNAPNSSAVTSANITASSCSNTNVFTGVSPNANGTYTLSLKGTPQETYYLVYSSDATAPLAGWTVLPGSTNLVTNSSGLWSIVVTNIPPKRFYNSKAVNPCP
jgi:trimeric autotransporter adhesin